RKSTSVRERSSAASSFLGSLRALRNFSLAATLGSTAYTVGASRPPPLLTFIAPRAAPPPLDPNLPEAPILLEHRAAEDQEAWYETRPYQTFSEERRHGVNNLVAGALRGPDLLALPPPTPPRRGLCGHDGIVHGGLLATLLDEDSRADSESPHITQNLTEKIGVTANLSVNYRAPTRADQFVVMRVRLMEVKGGKARVSGTVEGLDGNLFVQPRYARFSNKNAVLERIGAQPVAEPPRRAHEEASLSRRRSMPLPTAHGRKPGADPAEPIARESFSGASISAFRPHVWNQGIEIIEYLMHQSGDLVICCAWVFWAPGE
ncbi:HotDog domain-containing protein, partial [Lactarius psammicola]